MKNIFLKICLVTFALFGVVGSGLASNLPDCIDVIKHQCVGTLTYSDGSTYVGEFKNNKPSGQGAITWSSGYKYVGEFKDGKKSGQGTYTYPNGATYVGEWEVDKRSGIGTETYVDGRIYVGQYENNKINGQGTFTYANGDSYVGAFKDYKFNGQGTFTYANGDIYVGAFKDNEFNGEGTFTSSDGNTYVGEFKDGSVKTGVWEVNQFLKTKNPAMDDIGLSMLMMVSQIAVFILSGGWSFFVIWVFLWGVAELVGFMWKKDYRSRIKSGAIWSVVLVTLGTAGNMDGEQNTALQVVFCLALFGPVAVIIYLIRVKLETFKALVFLGKGAKVFASKSAKQGVSSGKVLVGNLAPIMEKRKAVTLQRKLSEIALEEYVRESVRKAVRDGINPDSIKICAACGGKGCTKCNEKGVSWD